VHFGYVIYKITFPNGKIYIGKDIGGDGHSLRYFGSWDNKTVAQDFTKEQLLSLTLKKDILFESIDKNEISMKEAEFIIQHQSNDPNIGYNKWPKK
jgi:hypothetical protein